MSSKKINRDIDLNAASVYRINGVPIYGMYLEKIQANSVVTITGAAFQNAVSLTGAASQPQGKYKINWSYGWNYDATNSNAIVELRLNRGGTPGAGGTLVDRLEAEPSENGGTGSTQAPDTSSTGTSQRYTQSGSQLIDINAGVNTLHLDLSSNGGTNLSVWNVMLEIFFHSAFGS